jgi:hypothetical protein
MRLLLRMIGIGRKGERISAPEADDGTETGFLGYVAANRRAYEPCNGDIDSSGAMNLDSKSRALDPTYQSTKSLKQMVAENPGSHLRIAARGAAGGRGSYRGWHLRISSRKRTSRKNDGATARLPTPALGLTGTGRPQLGFKTSCLSRPRYDILTGATVY